MKYDQILAKILMAIEALKSMSGVLHHSDNGVALTDQTSRDLRRYLRTTQENLTEIEDGLGLVAQPDEFNITAPISEDDGMMFSSQASSMKSATTKAKGAGSILANNPLLVNKPQQYPSVNGAYGPKFKIGTHSGILFRNALWVKIKFGDPVKGPWIEVTFNKNAQDVPLSEYTELMKRTVGKRKYGVTFITSEDSKVKWWGDYANFLRINDNAKTGGFLPLNSFFLPKNMPDLGGKKYDTDGYSLTIANMYDQSGLLFVPQYIANLGYDGGMKFPWGTVKVWSGGIDLDAILKKNFANGLGGIVSLAVSPGGNVVFTRSKNEKDMKVPAPATPAPTKQPTRTPTKKPTNKIKATTGTGTPAKTQAPSAKKKP